MVAILGASMTHNVGTSKYRTQRICRRNLLQTVVSEYRDILAMDPIRVGYFVAHWALRVNCSSYLVRGQLTERHSNVDIALKFLQCCDIVGNIRKQKINEYNRIQIYDTIT